ncbi:hypothetical protein H4219_001747 [Mycoemilia scoparia]|uniref:Fumarylacetoacetase n=1 Tax=Mycoemilia scoparia TaxID=417184 RepID=A0A9W8A5Y7_9FUNG|nr:hypothetical protein H4219_001747 [Mycoemilia scoparia]
MSFTVLTSTLVKVPSDSHFSIYNLPFGIFSIEGEPDEKRRVGVAIGEYVLDLAYLANKGLFDKEFENSGSSPGYVFSQPTLNHFMSLGRPIWKGTRQKLQDFLSNPNRYIVDPTLPQSAGVEATSTLWEREKYLVEQSRAAMHIPANIGDYTDFYASKEHATNVGCMFRGKDNALMPNWVHLPVGYHGRSSSIVVSGTPLHRPSGQRLPNKDQPPVFGPSKRLDFELEMGFFVGPKTNLGEPLTMETVEDHIFGVVLLNDWSARDIQAWEYVPLGPFLGKNFGTTISPWVVTVDALEPFLVPQPKQVPEPLPYLRDTKDSGYDIVLDVELKPNGHDEFSRICRSNLKYMYWTIKQQLVHHTVNGCNIRPGDLCGTGTISGPIEDSYGSLLELSWSGQKDVLVGKDGSITRKFIEDGDEVKLIGYCSNPEGNYIVGFGECVGKILPPKPTPYD